jgi:chitinase
VVLYADVADWWNYEGTQAKMQSVLDAGVTHLVLAFIVVTSSSTKPQPMDLTLAWEQTIGQQPDIAKQFQASRLAAGKYIMASVGGANSMSIPGMVEAFPDSGPLKTYANNLVAWCAKNYLDGIDFDLEGAEPMSFNDIKNVQWLANLSLYTRQAANAANLPFFQISHAPQGPYFSPAWAGANGGYMAVEKMLPPNVVDFYNIQYYNQGGDTYTTYNNIFVQGSTNRTSLVYGTAVAELIAAGMDSNKIVVGKPYWESDAGDGYTPCASLAAMGKKASTSLGWTGGFMFWQYHAEDLQCIKVISGSVAPCVTDCINKECGDDGCGGSCGACKAGFTCNAQTGVCEACVPNCAGKACGDNGCGGSCGACGPSQTCTAGRCVTMYACDNGTCSASASGTFVSKPECEATCGHATECYACTSDSNCGGGKCHWYPLGPYSDCPSCVVTSKNGCCSANSTPKYTCGNVLPPRINPLPSCVAVPNNAAHVTDAECSPCAKGQSYWPCNVPNLCVWK